MSGYTAPDQLVSALLAEEVYHSGAEAISSPTQWAQVSNYYDASTGYYGEAWEEYTVSATGAITPIEIMQVNRGTVFTTGANGPQNVAAYTSTVGASIAAVNLGTTANSDFWNTIYADSAILAGYKSVYLTSADTYYGQIAAQYAGIPIVETGQSLGGATSGSVVATNYTTNADLSALTYNALIYSNGNAGLTKAQATALPVTNYYVGNEVVTQNSLAKTLQWLTGGTQVGHNVTLPDLDVGWAFLNAITIHNPDAALVQMFRALYQTPSSPLYTNPSAGTLYAAKQWLQAAFTDYPDKTPSLVTALLGGSDSAASAAGPGSSVLSVSAGSSTPADAPGVLMTDTETNQGSSSLETSYTGSNAELAFQFIAPNGDDLALISPGEGSFIKLGNGANAVIVQSGDNLISLGTGSNFVVGGTGTDIVAVQADANLNLWDTLVNFHAGDSLLLWGYVPGGSTADWLPTSAGATGYEGLTLDIHTGSAQSLITFAGLSAADRNSFAFSTGTTGEGTYIRLTHA